MSIKISQNGMLLYSQVLKTRVYVHSVSFYIINVDEIQILLFF